MFLSHTSVPELGLLKRGGKKLEELITFVFNSRKAFDYNNPTPRFILRLEKKCLEYSKS